MNQYANFRLLKLLKEKKKHDTFQINSSVFIFIALFYTKLTRFIVKIIDAPLEKKNQNIFQQKLKRFESN